MSVRAVSCSSKSEVMTYEQRFNDIIITYNHNPVNYKRITAS